MTNLIRVYAQDGSFIDREMNENELAQLEIDRAEEKARIDAAKALAAKKAIAEKKLFELGFTIDELKALGLA